MKQHISTECCPVETKRTVLLKPKSIVSRLYRNDVAFERHRHRYEVNPEYHGVLQQNGLIFSGMSPNKRLVEFIEIPNHKFFVATQAHPELKSTLFNPAPLFKGLVDSAIKKSQRQFP